MLRSLAVALILLAARGAERAGLEVQPLADRIQGLGRYDTALANAARYSATDLVASSVELSWSMLDSIIGEAYLKVWIVGGTSVLPSTLEATLSRPIVEGGAGIPPSSIERFSGANRYETAAQVAGKITTVAMVKGAKAAFVVSGENFADAVLAAPAVAGPVGSVGVVPILLVSKNSVPAATAAAIGSLGIGQVFTLGGSAVISDSVINALKEMGVEVFPIFGANRYETALHLGNVLTSSVGAGGFGWSASNVGLANLSQARGGADALAASQLLARTRSVLLGTCR